MNTFQVTKEKTPERCLICHQGDFYDPLTDTCKRCNQYKLEQIKDQNINQTFNSYPISKWAERITYILLWLGWIPFAMCFHLFMQSFFSSVDTPGIYYILALFFYALVIWQYVPMIVGHLVRQIENKLFNKITKTTK
ncbi:MAG: hypothetical protein HY819_10595 [Acidobacteria bacterium]|nr:hypothetical protein [Acidobacteriota bacterium]